MFGHNPRIKTDRTEKETKNDNTIKEANRKLLDAVGFAASIAGLVVAFVDNGALGKWICIIDIVLCLYLVIEWFKIRLIVRMLIALLILFALIIRSYSLFYVPPLPPDDPSTSEPKITDEITPGSSVDTTTSTTPPTPARPSYVLPEFTVHNFSKKGLTLKVYTGPGENYIRGGYHASCNTSEEIKVCGWDGNWLLVLYNVDINGSGKRIGYVSKSSLKQDVIIPDLEFDYVDGKIVSRCSITDDPLITQRQLAILSEGDRVTCLATYENWIYIDVQTDAGGIRGFIPENAVQR